MAFTNNSSVLAVTKEVTAGTPVVPSVGTQFIAIQTGYTLEGANETIENPELYSGIGKAPSIVGLEQPTASIDHNYRHSGVEGTEPNFGVLVENAIGEKVTASTEYDTIAGSTAGTSSARAVLKVNTGIGSFFQKGQGVLIKDGVNGFNIRCVQSVATDDLSLSFNLAAAPASGVNLGKCVFYKPKDDSGSLSLWDYKSNGAALQVMGGAKVGEMSLEATAGQLLRSSFSFSGTSYFFDPINITSSDIYLDFLDNVTTRVITVSAKLYKDPHQLAAAIQTAMNALGSVNTFTCAYSNSTGKFTFTSNGTTFSLLFATGANNANSIGDKIGFSGDQTGALTYTSGSAQSWATAVTPTPDAGQPLVVKNMQVLCGSFSDYTCVSAQSLTINVSKENQNVTSICAESGVAENISTSRAVTADVVLTLSQHDAEFFKRLRLNSDTQLQFNIGTRTGWEAGKSAYVYMPTCKVTSCTVGESNSVVVVNLSLEASYGEVYAGWL